VHGLVGVRAVGSWPQTGSAAVDTFSMNVRVERWLALVPRGRFDLGEAFEFRKRDPDLGTAHSLDDEHRHLLGIGRS
jgi:hypothetical protein